ncbi:1-(5-phosphoribosyl)-5-amino-4-imidazole-carboxylate carboxylase [Spirochaetia bacterium]|nr:1-(5-phosphoribosyl)-5-amino-4-imidazole-carboxylate carboxylase [Spirochaetia bacterium]GHU34734.1 1-(5-phosphoribosyl)-5-amino-4-imidazole-carboxylate carboxylase [Spirochaetia bacterium]
MTDHDLGFAVLDSERHKRTGYPEAVYCRGKTTEQALAIISSMREQNIPVLATGASVEIAEQAGKLFGETTYDPLSKILTLGGPKVWATGLVAVVCAGTSDLPVAREALLTAEFYGSKTELIADVGVAGIHRLFSRLEDIRKARVIVAAAGMEGALPSVIAGLVSVPVIALPTSVGYGASFGGLAALLGMLNSCAPGISVVNIDNGFGAGYLANLINQGVRDTLYRSDLQGNKLPF